MRIEFVNHSSFVIDSRGVRLICDPWLGGTAFDDSWALLADTVFRYEDFARITHIWFSHEHPDHFHPPSLRRIPPELRERITIVYQTTLDRKVVEFCTNLGFKEVRELPSAQWVELAPDVSVQCAPQPGFQDSWLALRTPEGVVLNVNDCPLFEREAVRAVREKVGTIDVLATQFSISAWDGNPEELARRRAGAQTMLDRAVMHAQEFGPRYVLPIASFIWFCHEENAWMNSGFLPIAEVEGQLRTRAKSTPILMQPGDGWQVGDTWSSTPALERYAREQESLATRPLVSPKLVTQEALMQQSREFCRAMSAGSDSWRLKLRWAAKSAQRRKKGKVDSLVTIGKRVLSPETATVFVTDHAKAFAFHPERGLEPVELAADQCDVSLSSAALNYAFKFLWGGETLLFNGRFRESHDGSRERLFDYFHMAGARNFGTTATWRTLPRDVLRRGKAVFTRDGAATEPHSGSNS